VSTGGIALLVLGGFGNHVLDKPTPEGLKRIRFRLLSTALTLLSGAMMVLAGYIGGTESWLAAGFIAILGGLVILAARAAGRKADSGR
jgi:hypothetical protein